MRILGLIRLPLYRNTIFIMLTSILTSGVGFFFWMIASRMYSQDDIGMASALISLVAISTLISRLGLDQSLVRFLPERDRSRLITTSIVVSTSVSICVGIVIVVVVPILVPSISFSVVSASLFMVFVTADSISSTAGVSFVALRKGEYFFLQGVFTDSKVIVVAILVWMGAWGIFSSWGIASLATLAFSITALRRSGVRFTHLDRGFLRDSLHFSAQNYVVVFLMTLPAFILPIIVLDTLGPGEAAHYYIAYAIASLIFLIPGAFTTSLFVEGSHGEPLAVNAKRALISMTVLMIPAIVLIYFFGGSLLSLFGQEYAEGFALLRLLVPASLFVGVYGVFTAIKRVQRNMLPLVLLSAMISVQLVGLSYLMLPGLGLVAVGYAWIASYGSAAVAVVIMAAKSKRAGRGYL